MARRPLRPLLLAVAGATTLAGVAEAAWRAPAPANVELYDGRAVSERQATMMMRWSPVINTDTNAPYNEYILRARPGCTYQPLAGDSVRSSSAGPIIVTSTYTVQATCNIGWTQLGVRAYDRLSRVGMSNKLYIERPR